MIKSKNQLDQLLKSKTVSHSYSPGVEKLINLAETYLSDAEKMAERGENVVWMQGWQFIPLAYSCGVIPIMYSEMGLVGGEEAIAIAEKNYQVPPETCSMVKISLGEWYLRRNSPIKRIFGLDSACEPYNIAWEMLKNENYDIYTADVLYRAPGIEGERYEGLVRHFINETDRLALWFTGGKSADEKKFAAELKRKNRCMEKIRRIVDLRIDNPLYIKSLPMMFLLAGLNHYYGKPDVFGEVLDEIVTELEKCRPDSPADGTPVPLVWVGARSQNFGLYEAIDRAGGALLGFVNAPFKKAFREDLPPAESVARYTLNGQAAGAAVYRRGYVVEQVRKTGAKGIILHGFIGCSNGSVTNEMFGNYFREQGVPCLNLEGSFQVGPPSGQVLTRIAAFIEALGDGGRRLGL